MILIQKQNHTIKGDKLPTYGDIISYFYYVRKSNSSLPKDHIICCGVGNNHKILCDDQDCVCIVKRIVQIYDKAGIPTIRHDVMKKS